MSYSRRQLEALGETLGESVTRKEGGRIIYGGGGGGGGAATQTQVSDLPDWAKPTAQRNLGKAEALTSDKPYQSYGNWAQQEGVDPSRVAGFSGLQNQSFQGAQNLQPSGALRPAMGMAGAATMGSLGAGQNYMRMATDPNSMQGFMSPYMQNVVNSQIQEANRNYDISGTQQAAKAVQSGAFGGSRGAIMAAENERNRNTALGGIQAQGLQNAFQNAQQAQQFGSNLGLQGFGQAMQGAGQMANIGTQQFGQQKDALTLQNQFGGQQQANEQAKLGYNMQDYSAQQQYPYQQLSFLSNILRGTPMGGVTSMYGAQSTPAQMIGALGGLGMGAAGMMGAFNKKEGGLTESYADGGSVDSPYAVEDIVGKLSDGQLQQAAEAARARGDVQQLQAIQAEMAMRASERNGMANAFNQLPYGQQEEMMAGGGIIAFADEGLVNDPMGTGAQEIMSQPSTGMRDDRNLLERLVGKDPDPQWKQELRAKREADKSVKPKASSDAEIMAKATAELARLNAKKPAEPAAAPVAAPAASISNAVPKQATRPAPAEQGDSFQTNYKSMLEETGKLSKSQQKAAEEMTESYKKQIDDLRARGLNDALTQFGFQLAAAAGKPGGGLLRALGEAAPSITESLGKNQQMISATQDNMNKLKMDQARFDLAVRKGDMQAALGYAQAISAEKKAQQQIDLQRQHLGIAASQASKPGTAMQFAYETMRNDPANKGVSSSELMERAARAVTGYDKSALAADSKNNAGVAKIMGDYKMFEGMPPSPLRDKVLAIRDQQIAQLQKKPQGGDTILNYDSTGKLIQ